MAKFLAVGAVLMAIFGGAGYFLWTPIEDAIEGDTAKARVKAHLRQTQPATEILQAWPAKEMTMPYDKEERAFMIPEVRYDVPMGKVTLIRLKYRFPNKLLGGYVVNDNAFFLQSGKIVKQMPWEEWESLQASAKRFWDNQQDMKKAWGMK